MNAVMNKSASRGPRRPQKPAKKCGSDNPPAASRIGDHIGKELRAMFDDVVSEPVPEKFQNLLDELERKQSKSKS